METGYITLFLVIAVILVIAFVIVLALFVKERRTKRKVGQYIQGNLNVYCDPDYGPQLLLQLDVPIEDIVGRKQATFNVHVIQQISQK